MTSCFSLAYRFTIQRETFANTHVNWYVYVSIQKEIGMYMNWYVYVSIQKEMNTYVERVYVYTHRDRPTWPPEYTDRNICNCVREFMCTCKNIERENTY